MQRLRLMSHNVWNCDSNSPKWQEKGNDCSAQARVPGLLRVYRETLPDVIGGQEVSALMADLLREGLLRENMNYTLIWGRFTPILYRSDKLELIDSEFGSYPESIEGFDGSFNDSKSKSWNVGVFRIKENGRIFAFATTHLWWMKSPSDKAIEGARDVRRGSDEARELQIAMLIEKAEQYGARYNCPVFVVGDMNCNYNSKAMKYVRSHGFCHAHDVASEYSDDSMGYHYCFRDGYKNEYYDRPFEHAIDHIYVSAPDCDCVKRFERYSPDYYFPISDHSAVFADVEL